MPIPTDIDFGPYLLSGLLTHPTQFWLETYRQGLSLALISRETPQSLRFLDASSMPHRLAALLKANEVKPATLATSFPASEFRREWPDLFHKSHGTPIIEATPRQTRNKSERQSPTIAEVRKTGTVLRPPRMIDSDTSSTTGASPTLAAFDIIAASYHSQLHRTFSSDASTQLRSSSSRSPSESDEKLRASQQENYVKDTDQSGPPDDAHGPDFHSHRSQLGSTFQKYGGSAEKQRATAQQTREEDTDPPARSDDTHGLDFDSHRSHIGSSVQEKLALFSGSNSAFWRNYALTSIFPGTIHPIARPGSRAHRAPNGGLVGDLDLSESVFELFRRSAFVDNVFRLMRSLRAPTASGWSDQPWAVVHAPVVRGNSWDPVTSSAPAEARELWPTNNRLSDFDLENSERPWDRRSGGSSRHTRLHRSVSNWWEPLSREKANASAPKAQNYLVFARSRGDVPPENPIRRQGLRRRRDTLLICWRALVSGDCLVTMGHNCRFQYPLTGDLANSSLAGAWQSLGSSRRGAHGGRGFTDVPLVSELCFPAIQSRIGC